MPHCLDPDQVRRYFGPDLDANCLQRSSADEAVRLREAIIVHLPTLLSIYRYVAYHMALTQPLTAKTAGDGISWYSRSNNSLHLTLCSQYGSRTDCSIPLEKSDLGSHSATDFQDTAAVSINPTTQLKTVSVDAICCNCSTFIQFAGQIIIQSGTKVIPQRQEISLISMRFRVYKKIYCASSGQHFLALFISFESYMNKAIGFIFLY